MTTTADSGPGSLRDAITQINADTSHALYASPSNPNVDEIDFNIPSTDLGYNPTTQSFTIQPLTALPTITNAVILNGYSQPGATPNTLTIGDNAVLKIDLDGSQAGLVNGLNIAADNSTVEGLVVTNFGPGQPWTISSGISAGGGNDKIVGDFLGTDVTGTVAEGNGYGAVLYGTGDTIGGTDPSMRNIIAGNYFGVFLYDGNAVEGSYIGTDHTGTSALGNTIGVDYTGSDITIGGSAQGAGNVISANGLNGIEYGGFGPQPAT